MDKNIIIDNGTYEIKYGSTKLSAPKKVPNCIIRTTDKRILLGESLHHPEIITEFSNLIIKRPIEHGQLTQWSLEKQIWDNAFVNNGDDSGTGDYLQDSNLLYIENPITVVKFQNMTDQVIFEEYGVSNYVRCSGASLAPWLSDDDNKENNSSNKYKSFELVIDSGFDATWVVPMINGLPYYKGIRKMPIAGKFLNGYLREMISFRHYNVMEEPILVNNIKEQTCFVSENYDLLLSKISRMKNNSGIGINYILPDYKNDFKGHVLNDDELNNYKNLKNNDDLQSLRLVDERFAIPELMFHPELTGVYKSGIITTIKESLKQVPELLRPLLINNIVVMGGNFNLKGFEKRLVIELNKEVPIDSEVNILKFNNIEDKSDISWYAGKSFFEQKGFDKISLSRENYFEFGVEYAQEKFGYKLQ